MSEFDLPESGHGFESDGVELDDWDSPYGDPYYEGYYDQYDYEPSPYDGTYSEC